MDFPGDSDSKESACSAGDLGSILGLEISPGEGNGSLLQYSCLKNPMHRGTWCATVHGLQTVRHDFKTEHAHTHFIKQKLYGDTGAK